MLKDTNCQYVIVGHSERRHKLGEWGDTLRRKVAAVLEHGLNVIYCVGETLDEREYNRTTEVVERQLDEALTSETDLNRVTIAYEPVWAIGTGRNATPDQAQEIHAFIREKVGERFGTETAGRIRIQYGGSVKPDNAAGLLACPDIDGALVGGACLVAESFAGIIAAAVQAAAA
jgi:triosephosphate isomerase